MLLTENTTIPCDNYLQKYNHNIKFFNQQLPRHRSAEGALFWTFCLDNWQLLRWYALQIQPTGTDRTGKNLQGLYKMKLNNLCCGKVGYERLTNWNPKSEVDLKYLIFFNILNFLQGVNFSFFEKTLNFSVIFGKNFKTLWITS